MLKGYVSGSMLKSLLLCSKLTIRLRSESSAKNQLSLFVFRPLKWLLASQPSQRNPIDKPTTPNPVRSPLDKPVMVIYLSFEVSGSC